METMTYSTKMVALSQLSDAQELMSMGYIEDANKRINFAKRILIRYPNDTEVSEEVINGIWKEILDKNV